MCLRYQPKKTGLDMAGVFAQPFKEPEEGAEGAEWPTDEKEKLAEG